MEAESRAKKIPDLGRTVFRLSGIPNGVSTTVLVAALVAKSLRVATENVKVYSLATTLNRWERPPSRVATLMLRQTPSLFQKSREGQNEWTLESESDESGGGTSIFVLDTHFWGLTPLNDVATKAHNVDCIAISGLASHAFGSWQPRGDDKTFMWIRDQLPKYVPGGRAVLYGYDSRLADSDSFQSISDLALNFIAQIRAYNNGKPLVFLAHSLGGIVLKDALCKLANSQDNSFERKIFARCKGAIMFGVPNLGMEQNHLLALVRGNAAEHLVRDLSRESGVYGYLKRLELSFSGIAEIGEMSFFWVFETSKSPTFDPETGKMTGPSAVLVDPDSATTHRLDKSPSSVHPVSRNHSEMVKFTRTDANTGPIIDLIRRVCGLVGTDPAGDNLDTRLDEVESQNAATVPNRLIEESKEKRRIRLVKDFMSSLDSPNLDLRQSLIDDRFEHTCEWIYDYKSFLSWLKHDDTLFWISGKPGSGKSTLMKFIYTDSRTYQYSHTFEQSVCCISTGFFFNYRGTAIQKSFEGLMRSILRQIITQLQQASVITALLDDLLQSPIWTQKSNDPWPLTQMEEFLRAILKQKRAELRVRFFFDALDEFDGPPDYISRFVKYLVNRPPESLTHVKVCFSSRPWEDFVTNFSGSPNLAVEDFTKEDIRYFCTASLSDTLEEKHRDYIPRLVDEIVLRASSVFLWASLVLKELAMAFSDGQAPSLADLLSLLQSVPVELSKFYHFIIQRIPGTLRWRTYALLEAVVRARCVEERGITYLWKTTMISNCPNYDSALQASLPPNSWANEPRGFGEMQRLDILTWGGGLISAQPRTGVQLMHQTVYEFVTKLDFKEKVLESFSQLTYENGHTFHFKSALTFHLKNLLENSTDSYGKVPPLLNHGAEAEETTGRSCQLFFDSVPDHHLNNIGGVLLHQYSRWGLCPVELIPFDLRWSHAALATLFQLRLYLRDGPLLEPDNLRSISPLEDLLQLVVLALALVVPYDTTRVLSTAKLLLENGYGKSRLRDLFPCFLNPGFRDRIRIVEPAALIQPFEQLAILFLEHEPGCLRLEIKEPGVDAWIKAIHMARPSVTRWLLQHGVDPNEEDSVGQTPLDFQLIHPQRLYDPTWTWFEFREFECQRASILLEHGGKARFASDESWAGFLRVLRDEGHDISKFPEVLPRIPIENKGASSSSIPSAQFESEVPATPGKAKSSLPNALKRIFGKRPQR